MSRRDTIIVAVLINTGLLAVLFMMAMHNELPGPIVQTGWVAEAEPQAPAPEPVPAVAKGSTSQKEEETSIASRDELDEVLRNYTLKHHAPVVVTPQSREAEKKEPAPKKEVAKPSSDAPQYVEVTVKRGDYLEKIARANGTTVKAIMAINNLPSARIDIGQVLRVPVGQKKEMSEARANNAANSKVAASSEPQYYTLRSGDNPWKIAKQFHVRFDDLLKLNDLDEGKARNLKPGDVLRVK